MATGVAGWRRVAVIWEGAATRIRQERPLWHGADFRHRGKAAGAADESRAMAGKRLYVASLQAGLEVARPRPNTEAVTAEEPCQPCKFTNVIMTQVSRAPV